MSALAPLLSGNLHFFEFFSNTQSMTYNKRELLLVGSSWGELTVEDSWGLVVLPVWRCCQLLSSSHHGDLEMSSDPGIKQKRRIIQSDEGRMFTWDLKKVESKHCRLQIALQDQG